MRFLEKVADTHLVVVHWVVESPHRIGHFGDEDDEEEYMGNVKLPGAADDPRRGIGWPLQRERPAINESGSVPRDKNKDLCSIVELHCLNGEVTKYIFWNMIDKNQDQSDAAKEIKTKVPRPSSRHSCALHPDNSGRSAMKGQLTKVLQSRRGCGGLRARAAV